MSCFWRVLGDYIWPVVHSNLDNNKFTYNDTLLNHHQTPFLSFSQRTHYGNSSTTLYLTQNQLDIHTEEKWAIH